MQGRNWQWGSGAAVALVAAGTGLTAHLALRADSEHAPGRTAVLVGTALLSLVLWPLAARTTSIAGLTAVLVAAQFGAHALTVLADGQADADPLALVCCPSTTQVRPGILGELNADAGWALAAAQLLACLLLAVAIRGGRAGADLVATALCLARSVIDAACGRLAVLFVQALRRTFDFGVPRPAIPRPTPARVLDSGRVLARRTVRRGPPRAAFFEPVPSRAALAPLVSPAVG